MHTILSLVAIGLGVSLVPACVQSLQWQGVVCKRLGPVAPQTTITLTWHRDNQSAALHSLLAQAADHSKST